jgi:hypothetical protein
MEGLIAGSGCILLYDGDVLTNILAASKISSALIGQNAQQARRSNVSQKLKYVSASITNNFKNLPAFSRVTTVRFILLVTFCSLILSQNDPSPSGQETSGSGVSDTRHSTRSTSPLSSFSSLLCSNQAIDQDWFLLFHTLPRTLIVQSTSLEQK